MRMTAAYLLFAMAAAAWGRIALDRLAGGTMPAASVAQLLDLPAPPPGWGALGEALAAATHLEAGTAALAAALALALIDAVLTRR
ncbi:MAG: hypothetical protein ACM33T_17845 [Solirubrobacterales bacterium]